MDKAIIGLRVFDQSELQITPQASRTMSEPEGAESFAAPQPLPSPPESAIAWSIDGPLSPSSTMSTDISTVSIDFDDDILASPPLDPFSLEALENATFLTPAQPPAFALPAPTLAANGSASSSGTGDENYPGWDDGPPWWIPDLQFPNGVPQEMVPNQQALRPALPFFRPARQIRPFYLSAIHYSKPFLAWLLVGDAHYVDDLDHQLLRARLVGAQRRPAGSSTSAENTTMTGTPSSAGPGGSVQQYGAAIQEGDGGHGELAHDPRRPALDGWFVWFQTPEQRQRVLLWGKGRFQVLPVIVEVFEEANESLDLREADMFSLGAPRVMRSLHHSMVRRKDGQGGG